MADLTISDLEQLAQLLDSLLIPVEGSGRFNNIRFGTVGTIIGFVIDSG